MQPNEKEATDITSVEVSEVIEKFCAALIKLEKRVQSLEVTASLQAEALRMLGDVGKGHQKVLEAVTAADTKPPELPGNIPPESVN